MVGRYVAYIEHIVTLVTLILAPPMTLIFDLDLDISKMYLLTKMKFLGQDF